MSFSIVVVDPDVRVRTILKKNFEDQFGAIVYDFAKSEEAIKYLNEDPTIQVVIAKNFIENDLIANNLLNYIYDHTSKIPLIVIGEFEGGVKNLV